MSLDAVMDRMDTPPNFSDDTSIIPFHVHTAGFEAPYYITIVSCSVSITCALLLLLFLYRGILSLGPCTFMFASLTMSDMVIAIGYLCGVLSFFDEAGPPLVGSRCNSTLICVSQSFVTTWASMVSFIWTITIEVSCFLILWRHRQLVLGPRVKLLLSVMCFGIPLSITTSALFSRVLGFDSSRTSAGWCWIVSCPETEDVTSPDFIPVTSYLMWMLVAGKMWEILAYFTISNLVFFQLFRCYRRRREFIRQFSFDEQALLQEETAVEVSLISRSSQEEARNDLRECKLLFWIPVVMMIARIWGTLRFSILTSDIISGGKDNWLQHLNKIFLNIQGIGDCSQATCNFILVLIFRRRVRAQFNVFSWLRSRR